MYDVFELERWHLFKHEAPAPLELQPAPWQPAELLHRRRTATPIGTSVLVDFDAVISNPQALPSQELGYSP